MKRLTLLLTFIIAAGCTQKSIDRRDHAGPGGETVTDQVPDVSANQAEVEALITEEIAPLASLSGQDLITKHYRPVAKVLFREKTIIDHPLDSDSDEAKDILKKLNRAVLAILRAKDLTQAQKREISTEYVAEVFRGCNATNTSCPRTTFYRADYLSPEIVLRHAHFVGEDLEKTVAKWGANLTRSARASKCTADEECRSTLVDYYRLLSMSYNLSTVAANDGRSIAYVKFASYYAFYIRSLDDKSRPEELLQAHRLKFQNAMGIIPSDSDDPELKELLDASGNFNFSRKSMATFDDVFFLKSAEAYLYDCADKAFKGPKHLCPADKISLSASFKKALQDKLAIERRVAQTLSTTMTKEDRDAAVPDALAANEEPPVRNIDSAYLTEISVALNTKYKDVLKNLNLDTNFERDEYFYIVDGLFHGDLTSDDAAAFWAVSRQDFSRLKAVTDKYLKVYMVYMIGETNAFMNRIYSQRSKWTSEELVSHALQKVKEISQQWVNMRDNVELSIGGFVGKSLTNFAGFEAFKNELNYYKTSVKFTSVYPNMMMMMYYLSDVNYEFTVMTWFGPITINAAMLTSNIFGGFQSPWFYFGNDTSIALDEFEILYAFHYALKTEIFEAFGNIPSLADEELGTKPVNIDEYQYFNLVFPAMYDKTFQDLSQQLGVARNFIRDSNYLKFKALCGRIIDPANQKGKGFSTVTTDEWRESVGTYPEYRDTLTFYDLTRTTFLDIADSSRHPYVTAGLEIFRPAGFAKSFAAIVNDLDPWLDRAKHMVSILRVHFNDKVRAETDPVRRAKLIAEYEVKLANIDKIIARTDNNISAIESFWVNTFDEVQNCAEMVGYVSRARSVALYEAEKAYIKRVWSWMSVIQLKDPSDQIFLADKTYPQALAALDRLASENSEKAAVILEWKKELQTLASTSGYRTVDVNSGKPLLSVMNEWLQTISKHPLVPADNKEGPKKYPGFDEIRWTERALPPSYQYFQTDMMFRFLDYYKEGIAPNIYANIVMPADLTGISGNATYKNRAEMLYADTFENFLLAAGDPLGGNTTNKEFVSLWPRNFTFDLVNSKPEIMRKLYALGDMNIYPNTCAEAMISMTARIDVGAEKVSDDPEKQKAEEARLAKLQECQAQKTVRRVTVEDMVANHFEALKYFNLQPKEQEILVDLNKTSGMYSRLSLKNIILDGGNDRIPQSWFQKDAEAMMDMTKTFMWRSQRYYTSQRNVGTLVFDVDEKVRQIVKCTHYHQLNHMLDGVTKFRDLVMERQKADLEKFQTNPESMSITFGYEGGQLQRVASAPNGVFSYILGAKVQDIGTAITKFHNETSNFFNAANPDKGEAGEGNPIYSTFMTKEECAKIAEPEWRAQ